MSFSHTPVILQLVLESFPVRLRTLLRSRILPDEGSKKDIKHSVFTLHDLYEDVFAVERKMQSEYLRLHFSAHSNMPLLFEDKPVPANLTYRKIYHLDGSSAVLFDRKQFLGILSPA